MKQDSKTLIMVAGRGSPYIPSFLLLHVFTIFICRVFTVPKDIYPKEPKASVPQKRPE